MTWQSYFKDKKITAMGLGLLGRGLGDIRCMAEAGAAEIIVTDLRSAEVLKPSIESLKDLKNITFVLGEHRLEDFRNRDFIFKAASVPLDSPYIAEARKHNIPIEMSASLFAALSGITVVGITGTRGKSTVTQLVFDVLQKTYEGSETKVFLGGNVKGVANLPFIKEAKKGDVAVMELDSWQLQGFGERNMSPHIAVFTTFLPDHLNYYKGDLRAYLEDKAQIFKYQSKDDVLVISENVNQVLIEHNLKKEIKSKIIVAELNSVPENWHIQIPGEHNKLNIALAIEAARAFGIKDEIIKQAVEQFKGVPGRLELIKEFKGIKIYNDTNSTTPDATIVGLRALSKNKNVVLIIGGADKNLDMSKLPPVIQETCKEVILLAGTGTEKIKGSIKGEIVNSLKEAVQKALAVAEKGDVILLSPAFASFGMFINEYDRGEKFNNIVHSLRE